MGIAQNTWEISSPTLNVNSHSENTHSLYFIVNNTHYNNQNEVHYCHHRHLGHRRLCSVHRRVASIPACAQTCLATAIGNSGSGVDDNACQCGDANAAITREATPCVISGCSSEEALNTQSITSQICALVAAGGSSGGSSAASSAATSAASSVSSAASSAASSATSMASSMASSMSSAASSAASSVSQAATA